MRTHHRYIWLTIGLFAIVALVVYGESLRNALVLWDDTYLVANNPIIRSITPRTLWYAFTTFDPELYIPLTFVSYQIDHLIAGPSATMIHATNLVLHTLNSLLVAGILGMLLHNRKIGIVCGLLFLVHPLNVEAVSWASGRKDVLSAFFGLSALMTFLLYIDRNDRRLYCGSIILFLCALLSKVTIAPLGIVLLLAALQNNRSPRESGKMAFPFLALSVLMGIVAIVGKSHVDPLVTVQETIALSLQSLAFVISKIVLPLNLAPMYPVDLPVQIFTAWTIVGVILLMLFLLAAFLARRRLPTLTLGIVWFLLFFLPSVTTFSKGESVFLTSDRYAYVAMIGIFLALGSLFARYRLNDNSSALGIFGFFGLLGIFGFFGFLSHRQSLVWRDSETLFLHTLAVQPRAAAAANNLGVLYMREENLEAAEEQFRRALAIRPLSGAHSMLGNLRLRQQRIQEALAEYDQAIALAPRDPEPLFFKGVAQSQSGNRVQAIATFEAVLKLQLQYMPAMNNLAALLLEQGDLERSESIYAELLAYNPFYHDAQYNYALLLHRRGKDEEALVYIRSALEHSPDDTGVAALALEIAQSILKLDDDNASARSLIQWMLEKKIVQTQ